MNEMEDITPDPTDIKGIIFFKIWGIIYAHEFNKLD